jgi:uncharacterized protein
MDETHAIAIAELHQGLDRRVSALNVIHAKRLQCARGCSSCCIDELTVFAVEADHIALHNAPLLESGKAHAKGACAFLDLEGACRIYEQRPYVCRTQGLPLRWINGADQGSLEGEPITESRDICSLNENADPIEAIAESDCFTLGPAEEQLARLQVASSTLDTSARPGGGARPVRVSLRSLFR